MEEDERLDDFHMAAVSWLLLKEWDNSMWSEKARNSLLARLIILPWWLDEQGLDTTSLLFSCAGSFLHPDGVDIQYWSENHQMGW